MNYGSQIDFPRFDFPRQSTFPWCSNVPTSRTEGKGGVSNEWAEVNLSSAFTTWNRKRFSSNFLFVYLPHLIWKIIKWRHLIQGWKISCTLIDVVNTSHIRLILINIDASFRYINIKSILWTFVEYQQNSFFRDLKGSVNKLRDWLQLPEIRHSTDLRAVGIFVGINWFVILTQGFCKNNLLLWNVGQ